MQLAKAFGLRVIGTASTEQGLQAIRDQGADFVFNHKQEGYLREIAVCFFHNHTLLLHTKTKNHILIIYVFRILP